MIKDIIEISFQPFFVCECAFDEFTINDLSK